MVCSWRLSRLRSNLGYDDSRGQGVTVYIVNHGT